MERMVKQLIEILKEELAIYKDMLDISMKKTKVITTGSAKELDKITQVEQAMILKVGHLEKERENILEEIKLGLKIEGDVSISTLVESLGEEYRNILVGVKEELLETLNKIKERNELNSMLINDSLEYINFNLNLLTNTSAETTYSNKVKKDIKNTNKSLFDAKV